MRIYCRVVGVDSQVCFAVNWDIVCVNIVKCELSPGRELSPEELLL